MDKADIFSLRNLYQAYMNCRKSKRGSRCVLQFELQAEENLIKLQEELNLAEEPVFPLTGCPSISGWH